jgi:hypothetical protein
MIEYLLESLDLLTNSGFELAIEAQIKRQMIASLVNIIFEFYPLLRHYKSLSADSVHYLQTLYNWLGRDLTQFV